MQTKVQRIQSQGKSRFRAVKVILWVPFWARILAWLWARARVRGFGFEFGLSYGFRFPLAALTTTNVAGNQVNSAPNCINSSVSSGRGHSHSHSHSQSQANCCSFGQVVPSAVSWHLPVCTKRHVRVTFPTAINGVPIASARALSLAHSRSWCFPQIFSRVFSSQFAVHHLAIRGSFGWFRLGAGVTQQFRNHLTMWQVIVVSSMLDICILIGTGKNCEVISMPGEHRSMVTSCLAMEHTVISNCIAFSAERKMMFAYEKNTSDRACWIKIQCFMMLLFMYF